MHNLNITKTFYNMLEDEESRFIYEKRSMLALTDDEKYVDDIIDSVINRKLLDDMIAKAMSVKSKLAIRGTGNELHMLMRRYPELEWAIFVDRDPLRVEQGEFLEHKVVAVEEFYKSYSDYYVLVCSSAFAGDIVDELKSHGIDDEQILNFGGLWQTGVQYFDTDIIKPIAHEVFVDGGCYDGTTVRNFVSWCGGNYDAIYSYEPDRLNYERTLKLMEQDPVKKLTLYNKGLWDKTETLYFNESGGQGSGIVNVDDPPSNQYDESSQLASIEATSIDESVSGDKVTFIKLDVEGAEYEALVGAKNTITKHHPRMAISIYHKPEDIFTLPELIMEMEPDYKFYLRHYQMSRFETILYCV